MAVNDHDETQSAQDARLARAYREASREQPPPHLDRAIARAARQPARASRAPRWWTSWRVPFAVAAVAVVSVSLVTLVQDEGAERLTHSPASGRRAAETPAQATQPNGPAPQSEPAKAARAPARPQRAQPDEPAVSLSRERSTAPESAVTSDAEVAAPASIPMPRAEDASAERRARSAPAAPAARAPQRKLEREDAASPALAAIAPEIAKLRDEPAQVWVERVAVLRREGRDAEAEALLVEIAKRFPDFELPAQIR